MRQLVFLEFLILILMGLLCAVALKPKQWASTIAVYVMASVLFFPVRFAALFLDKVGHSGYRIDLESIVVAFLVMIPSIIVFRFSALVVARSLTRLSPVPVQSHHPVLHGTVSRLISWMFLVMFIFAAIASIAAEGVGPFLRVSTFYQAIMYMMIFWYTESRWDSADRITKGKFVLFLRQFNSFADESLVLALLQAVPSGVPVVFLVAHESNAATWDPVLVGFSGMKTRRSRWSGPIFMSAPMDSWLSSVQALARSATCIVMDISDTSTSIDMEVNLIKENNLEHKTLWTTSSKVPRRDISASNQHENNVVSYDRSWLAALPRMIIGFFASIATSFLGIGSLVEPFERRISNDQIGYFAIIPVLCASLLFNFFFCRPVLGWRSYFSFKKRIRSILKQVGN